MAIMLPFRTPPERVAQYCNLNYEQKQETTQRRRPGNESAKISLQCLVNAEFLPPLFAAFHLFVQLDQFICSIYKLLRGSLKVLLQRRESEV